MDLVQCRVLYCTGRMAMSSFLRSELFLPPSTAVECARRILIISKYQLVGRAGSALFVLGRWIGDIII